MKRTAIFVAAASVLLSVGKPALAWEPEGADAGAREALLERAWKGRPEAAVLKDKLKRAKQKKAPEWTRKVDKTVFMDTRAFFKAKGADGSERVFGVGIAKRIKNTALAVSSAQDQGTAALLQGASSGTVRAMIVDWYREKDGTVYALSMDLGPAPK